MSGTKKLFAPAAVACALGAAVVPSNADAKKKPNCDEFKPDLTVSASKESAATAEAKNAMIGAKGSTESASTATSKELSDEEVAAQTKIYNACVAFQKDLIDDATWQAAFLAYQGIDAPVQQQPAQQQPAQQQPAPTTQPVIMVMPQTAEAPARTPAQRSGGSGTGKAVLWTVIGIALVVGIIVLVAKGGSDDGGDEGTSDDVTAATE